MVAITFNDDPLPFKEIIVDKPINAYTLEELEMPKAKIDAELRRRRIRHIREHVAQHGIGNPITKARYESLERKLQYHYDAKLDELLDELECVLNME